MAEETIDWIQDAGVESGLPLLSVGNWVRTNYGTGPYMIEKIAGPCDCPAFLPSLEGDETPSEPHYHLVCRGTDGSPAWLNGYRPDGTSVWSDDEIELTDPGR